MPASPTVTEIERLRRELDDARSQVTDARTQITERDEAIAVRDETIARMARDLRLTKEEIEYLRRRLFRSSAETLPAGPTLFDQLGVPPEDLAPDDEGSTLSAREEAEKKKRAKRPRGRKPLPAHLERVRVEIPLDPEEMHCGACGSEKVKIGEDTSETLHHVPARYEVHVTARGRYACRCGEGGVACPPAPPRPIPGSYAGASLLALVLVRKFADHMPLYRQADILRREGLDIRRSTLTDWIGGVMPLLEPVAAAVRESVLAHTYLQADETPVLVQKAAKGRPKDGYFFAYAAPESDEVFYDFRGGRSRDGPSEVLAHYRGTLQVDGYAGYDEVVRERDLVAVACLAHIRRKFHEAFDTAPSECTLVLLLIRRLYRVEKHARRLSPEHRLALRQKRSRPIFERLAKVIGEFADRTSPGSRFGKAIAYAQGQWERMARYLEDGRVEVDNNSIERNMRGIAMGRRAWLFCGNEEGGRRAAVLYTLVENCRRAGVEPYAYLCDILARLPTTPVSRVADLTPHRWRDATRD